MKQANEKRSMRKPTWVQPADPVDKRIVAADAQIYSDMKTEFQNGAYDLATPFLVLDPYSAAPLSAQCGVSSTVPTKLSIQVLGKPGGVTLSHSFDDGAFHTQHFFPIYGLYAGYNNQVQITLLDEQGQTTSNTISIQTQALPADYGTIDIQSAAIPARLNTDLYYNNANQSYLSAMDYLGEVRWLILETYTEYPVNFVHESTAFMINSGRLLVKHVSGYALCEIDQMGRIYKITDIPYVLHHDVVQLPNGNLLIQIEDPDRDTVEDELGIMDYSTGEFTQIIDFKTILDPTRIIQPTTPPPEGKTDWLHENSIDYDENTQVYITSSRHQNVVFATDWQSNEIRWMMGPHDDWSSEFREYLLTPVDAAGQPLYDLTDPTDKLAADHDFWNWAQHGAKLLRNASTADTLDIMLFDDGCYRSYDEENWIVPYENWSRAVCYRINHVDMTVQKLWEFGRSLGQDYYSGYVGNVQYIPETNSMYINFGGTNIDLDTGRNVGIPGDVPMSDFPPEDYDTAPLLEKTRIAEVDIATGDILLAYDLYNPALLGIYKNGTYIVNKWGLYTDKTSIYSVVSSAK